MEFELILSIVYRAMALGVALMMIWVLFREADWRQQMFAMLIMIPFVLRAAGVK